MRIEKSFITRTVQSCSRASLNEIKKNNTDKPEAENNRKLFFSVIDSLNSLYDELNSLNYLMQKKIMEHNLSNMEKGEKR